MTLQRLLAATLLCAACSGPARENRPAPKPVPRAAAPPAPVLPADDGIAREYRPQPEGRTPIEVRNSAMTHEEFRRLLNAMDIETGGQAKLSMLETAARHSYFSTAQAGALIDHVVYRDDKLLAVPLLKDRILDQQNVYLLYQHFNYREDKARVQELLER